MLARTTTCARESCLVNRLHLRIKDEDRMVFSGIPIKRERRGKLQIFFTSDKSRLWIMETTPHEVIIFRLMQQEIRTSRLAGRAVAHCEARAAVERRTAMESDVRLRSRDAVISNLQETVAALTGRVQAEIMRSDKLSSQNVSLKELLNNVSVLSSGGKDANISVAAKTKHCRTLEKRIAALFVDHRAAQRRLSQDLKAHVKVFDAQRSGFDADLSSLHSRNRSLFRALRVLASAATSAGFEVPAIAAAELAGGSEAAGGPERPTTYGSFRRCSPSPFRIFAAGTTEGECNGTQTNRRTVDTELEAEAELKASQKKHAARLKAARGSASKWGFSV